MWTRITPTLTKAAATMFAPSADILKHRYDPLPKELQHDWFLDWMPPAPLPQPWYRRLRRRALDGAWRIIEAL